MSESYISRRRTGRPLIFRPIGRAGYAAAGGRGGSHAFVLKIGAAASGATAIRVPGPRLFGRPMLAVAGRIDLRRLELAGRMGVMIGHMAAGPSEIGAQAG